MFRRVFFLFLFFLPSFIFSQGTWLQKASIPALGRLTAVAFTIGTKGYLGTGLGSNNLSQNDFWEYDPVANSWTQKANFGGGRRSYAFGFSIGSKGYLGAGQNSTSQNDFWAYDPVTNGWTQATNYPGAGWIAACGFSIGNKGYAGTGVSPSLAANDFWQYDPAANAWSALSNFLGTARWDIDRACFVIGTSAYLGTGGDNTTKYNDFWEYNSITNGWTQKANYPGQPVIGTTGFSICNKGYLGLGVAGTNNYPVGFWKYNPVSNSWSAAAPFPAQGRADQPAFVINNKAYIGTGQGTAGNYFTDLWEYTPDSALAVVAAILSNAAAICAGQSATLTASGGSSYSWSSGTTANPLVVSPAGTTTYSLIAYDVCGSDTTSATITVLPFPSANFSYEYSCSCGGIQFTNQSANDNSWDWWFGDGTTGTSENPCHPYANLAPSNYTVTLIANPNSVCRDTSQQVISAPDGSFAFFVPNAFSPYDDNENGTLFVKGTNCVKDFHFIIYDRWGEKRFETRDVSEGWNGSYKGKKENTGVFTYFLTAILTSDKMIKKKGNVSLIR